MRPERGEDEAEGGGCGGRDALGENGKSGRVKRGPMENRFFCFFCFFFFLKLKNFY